MTPTATLRAAAFLAALALPAACAVPDGGGFSSGDTRVTPAQACAIGWDVARETGARVSVRGNVLLAPRGPTECERHALVYLRRAGFRIDETGQGGIPLDIRLSRIDTDTVGAVARIGDGLRIARAYRPVRTGVVAAGPPAIQHLDPDTYTERGR